MFFYIHNYYFVCPYIVDWSMRDEMSGMTKKQQLFDANEVFRYVSHSLWVSVTLQCHFNQPRPFSHYRAKEASDFDGHRFYHNGLYDKRALLIPQQFSFIPTNFPHFTFKNVLFVPNNYYILYSNHSLHHCVHLCTRLFYILLFSQTIILHVLFQYIYTTIYLLFKKYYKY